MQLSCSRRYIAIIVSGTAIISFADIPEAINLGYRGGVSVEPANVVIAVLIQVVIEIMVDFICCGYEKKLGIPIVSVWQEMISAPLCPTGGLGQDKAVASPHQR